MKFTFMLAVIVMVKGDKKQDKRGLLNLGYGYGGLDHGFGGYALEDGLAHVTVTKEVPVPVPQPYPVTVERHVPVPVKVPVAVPVDRPYPVHIPKPYPVHVEKPVPYPVEGPVPYPVKVPVRVPYPVSVPVHVPEPVAIPVPQPVVFQKQVPVLFKGHDDLGGYGLDAGYEFGGYGEHIGFHTASDFTSAKGRLHLGDKGDSRSIHFISPLNMRVSTMNVK